MSYQFSPSGVEYASHQLSLYYGECPSDCRFCFLKYTYRKRKIPWACGPIRVNEKAFSIAKTASKANVRNLVVSFTNDPLPLSKDEEEEGRRLGRLYHLLSILESRQIPTKVLTKNMNIHKLARGLQNFEHLQVGMSVTTDRINDKESLKWEPNICSPGIRFETLEYLHEHNIRTWASVEPILPKTDISFLILDLLKSGVEEIWVGKPNYVSELQNAFNWRRVVETVVSINSSKIHIKRELREYLPQSGSLEEYLCKQEL